MSKFIWNTKWLPNLFFVPLWKFYLSALELSISVYRLLTSTVSVDKNMYHSQDVIIFIYMHEGFSRWKMRQEEM